MPAVTHKLSLSNLVILSRLLLQKYGFRTQLYMAYQQNGRHNGKPAMRWSVAAFDR